MQNAKILRVHFSESDHFDGKPLYEAIVAKCRDLQIAGATVFRGLEGYGGTGEMHQAHLVGHDQPIIVTIIDSAENVARIIPAIEAMMDTGLIASSDVRCIRVRKDEPAASS